MDSHNTLGESAKSARKAAGFGLREAARRLGISASYLSRIERDQNPSPPSAALLNDMSMVYGIAPSALFRHAEIRKKDFVIEQQPELLQRLYRIAEGAPADEILALIHQLVDQLPPDVREKWRAKLNTDFHREQSSRGLFAARVKPRILSRIALRRFAEKVLADFGLCRRNYAPPTPIEEIIENVPNLTLVPSDPSVDAEMVCRKDGTPVVLGLTHWEIDGVGKVIRVNDRLYSSENSVDRHRLNFTLAHELWHAVEHLDLIEAQFKSRAALCRTAPIAEIDGLAQRSKGPNWWDACRSARRLSTPEDWQEWQSDAFAAELLLPHWHVKNEFVRHFGAEVAVPPSGVKLEQFADLLAGHFVVSSDGAATAFHEIYAVSRQAMAIRLMQLNLVVDDSTPAVPSA